MKFALVIVFAISLPAQEPRFDVRSRLVLIPVNVMDGEGRAVEGLDASDFRVLDNGRRQKSTVDTIATGVAPIALVVAVESAGISAAVLEKVRKIAGMIQPLITGDRGCAGLLSFGERIRWLQTCTTGSDAIERAYDRLRPAEAKEARMLDGAIAAIDHLRDRPNARRVLLLISETRDRGSETDLGVVIAAAQAAGVTVYAATYSAFVTGFTSKLQVRTAPPTPPDTPVPNPMGTLNGAPPSKYNPKIPPPEQRVDLLAAITELARLRKVDTVEALAKASGGTAFAFTRQKGLEDAIEKLSVELHSQYLLSFSPDSLEPGYHRLDVVVARPGVAQVRSRPAYWMAEKEQ